MKKRLALLVALVLAFAFSAQTLATDVNTNSDATQVTVVDGDGNTHYVDLDILRVTVPTDNTMNFILDPQGLMGIISQGGTSSDLDALAVNAGKILHKGTALPYVINNSPVAVTVGVKVRAAATGSDIHFVASASELGKRAGGSATSTDIFLLVEPSQANVKTVASAGDNIGSFTGSGNGYAVSSTGTDMEMNFQLIKAAYTIENTGTDDAPNFVASLTPGTGNGTMFKIGGAVNTAANWENFKSGGTHQVGLKAVFTIAKASPVSTASDIDDAFGLKSATASATDLSALGGGGGFEKPTELGFANIQMSSATNGGKVPGRLGQETSVDFNFKGGTINWNTLKMNGTAVASGGRTNYEFDNVNDVIILKQPFAVAGERTYEFQLTSSNITYTFILDVK